MIDTPMSRNDDLATQAYGRKSGGSFGFAAVRRRWWIVPLTMLAVLAAAYAVGRWQEGRYTAKTTLIVPSDALGPTNPGNADQAADLAATYATVISEDSRIAGLVSRRTGLQEKNVRQSLTARRVGGRALLQVSFRALTREKAISGARAAMAAVSGPAPITPSISPRSLSVVRSPTRAKRRVFKIRTVRRVGGELRGVNVKRIRWISQVTLIVPSGAGSGGSGNMADAANKVATTYAALIPRDDAVIREVADDLGVTPDVVRSGLRAVNEPDTSLITVSFRGEGREQAVKGARGVARSLTGDTPAATGISPRSLRVVSLPEEGLGDPARSLFNPIAGVLGLALGLMLLFAWDRWDARVDGDDELSAESGAPATSLRGLSDRGAVALLDRWSGLARRTAGDGWRRIALVPVSESSIPAARDATKRLLAASRVAGRDVRVAGSELDSPNGAVDLRETIVLVPTGVPGSSAAGELDASDADLVVAVAGAGTKLRELRSSVARLGEFAAAPRWALFVPRGRWLRSVDLDDDRAAADMPTREHAAIS